MASISTAAPQSTTLPTRWSPTLLLLMLWHIVVGAGAWYIAYTRLWPIEDFFRLGNFVPRLLALIAFGVGAAAFASVPLMAMYRNAGRMIGILLNFFGFAFALLLVGHLLNLYVGLDQLAESTFNNAILLLGIPLGYALVWLGRRFAEDTSANEWLQKVGLGVMGLTVFVLLLTSGWPQRLAENPGAALGQIVRADVAAALIVCILFFVAGSALLRMGERFGETVLQREAWQGWLFLMPNFVNFLLFFALPLILSLYLSFTNYDAISAAEWTGLDNYTQLLSLDVQSVPDGVNPRTLLRENHFEIARFDLGANDVVVGARDALFWQSMARTFRYCIMLLILGIVPALGLALLLNSKIPGMTFFRAVYFLPSIAAVVGVSLIWQWLYNPVNGFINYTITQIATALGIADPSIQWLSDDSVLLISVVIMAAWQIIGFNTVILLAGLQGVPKDLIEAATVDGAGSWVRFRRILMPLIAPTMFFVTITTLISGLQVFSEMYTLFSNSLSNERFTVVYYLYQQGFANFRMGYASATAWVLFAVIFIITLVQFRLSSSNRAYSD